MRKGGRRRERGGSQREGEIVKLTEKLGKEIEIKVDRGKERARQNV